MAKALYNLKPYLLNVLANFLFAGYNIISKVSLEKGMNGYVLIVYGQMIRMLTTAILALLFERMETLDIFKPKSQAKIWGTLVVFAGATVMTLYRGIILISPPFQNSIHGATTSLSSDKEDWINGSIVLLIGSFSLVAFYILQSAMLKKYPAPIWLTSLTCLWESSRNSDDAGPRVQSFFMEVALGHRLLAPVYSGVMIFGGATYLQTLVIMERGPVFMMAFRPLGTILVAMMGLLTLGEVLHLGSVVGAVFVFVGLHMVIRGKEENSKQIERVV